MRANRTPGSVRGAPGNRCPYLDISQLEKVDPDPDPQVYKDGAATNLTHRFYRAQTTP